MCYFIKRQGVKFEIDFNPFLLYKEAGKMVSFYKRPNYTDEQD